MAFLNALFTAALDNNLVFSQLIGMVSVVLVAARPQDSFRFGGLIAVATAIAGALGWPLCTQLMQPWGRRLSGSARVCARELGRHCGRCHGSRRR